MSKTRRGALELHEDIPLERSLLVLQKAGRVLLIVMVIFAAAGLFGSGALGRAVSRSENGSVAVAYDRLGRRLNDSSLRIQLASSHTVYFERAYLRYAEIQAIEPPPSRVAAVGKEIAYSFDAESAHPLQVEFSLSLRNKPGIAKGAVRVGEQTARFRQVIFP